MSCSTPSSIRKHPHLCRFPCILLRPTALLPAAVLLFADRTAMALLPPAAAVCHELGHLAAMLLFGIPVREIDITPLGAVIRTAPAAPNACRDAIVHLAGPAVNLLCAAWLLLPGCTPAMQIFAISSLALALFNLLPIRSLDGGCAAAILLAFIAPTHAQIIGELLSAASLAALWLTAGYLLLLCGGNLSLFVICVFLFAELYLK